MALVRRLQYKLGKPRTIKRFKNAREAGIAKKRVGRLMTQSRSSLAIKKNPKGASLKVRPIL